MEIGIGLDPTLGLTYEEQAEISAEAARLGYTQIWTPENVGEDSFQVCAWRWSATRDVAPGGVTTGIGVCQAALRTPMGFAMSAGTLSRMSGGRFILGLGSGGADIPGYRRTWGVHVASPLTLMRECVTAVRALVRGETLDFEGEAFAYRGARLAIAPPPETPVFVGALGPEMLRLAGEVADGVCLNWCTADQVRWSRERLAEGSRKAGRNPDEVRVMEYIRVCVDEDEDVARRAFARSMCSYALGQLGARPRSYRAHFERMGFAGELAKVDEMRSQGVPQDDWIEAVPMEMLLQVGYCGRPEGAAEAVRRLSEGLDIAVVRVVAARPGIESVRAVMRACAPLAAQARS
ncbi:MAG TPA: LLM class flavin-dependent oxidoreductase [Dehalococcoidia bacterium]|nr:LLM class flavin-dependent oxidoreductase [Dehalococcoidia bacterium]